MESRSSLVSVTYIVTVHGFNVRGSGFSENPLAVTASSNAGRRRAGLKR